MQLDLLRERVEAAYRNRALLDDAEHREAVEETLASLDAGEIRVAEHDHGTNTWNVLRIDRVDAGDPTP